MQFKRITIFLLVALVLVTPLGLDAAFNDFQTNADITVNLSGINANLTVKNGANVQSMLVEANSISLTLLSGSSIVIESANRYQMSSNGFTSVSFSCPSSGSSKMTITAAATESGSVSVSATTCGSSGASSGGGGTPPAPTVITPTNPTISIDAGDVEATSKTVELTLSATNATQMMISNEASFAGSTWETYVTSKTWTLSDGLGKKTVYVKYRSSTNTESSVVSDDVMLLPTKAVENIVATAGGKVGLSDNLVSVDVPANAIKQNAELSITPTTLYTAPPSGRKVVSSKAYNLVMDASGTAITKFETALALSFKYTDADLSGLLESTLAVYYWDTSTNTWVKIGGAVDTANNVVTASTDHFTLFALMADQDSSVIAAGDLVKLVCDGTNASICSAVYYLGNDGKRYVFPNSKVYFSWYDDFSSVKTVSASKLASYTIGGNVNYRPGVKMVKIDTDPKVYAVAKNGELRWVKTELVAKTLYGADWNTKIDDIPDAFFFNYSIGTEIGAAANYSPSAQKAGASTINMDKDLVAVSST